MKRRKIDVLTKIDKTILLNKASKKDYVSVLINNLKQLKTKYWTSEAKKEFYLIKIHKKALKEIDKKYLRYDWLLLEPIETRKLNVNKNKTST